MYETMAHFLAFEEYYIKKDFITNELTFDDTDEEMVDLIRFLGNFLLNNGLTIYQGFPVHYKTGRLPDADLEECVNAVHRLKTTFMHKDGKTADVTFQKKKKTIHFVNHYNGSGSSFDMDVTIPESFLLRVIKSYFDKKYNVMTTEAMLKYFPSYNVHRLSKAKESIFDQEIEKIMKYYHLDPKKTKVYRNFIALGREKRTDLDFYKYARLEQSLLKKLQKLEDKNGFITVYGENFFDAVIVCKSDDFNILSIYESKVIIRGLKHSKDKKTCHLQGIADNLQISPMNPLREAIGQLYLELLKIKFLPCYPNLDLSDFHIKVNKSAGDILTQFYNFDQTKKIELEQLHREVDEKLEGTKNLDVREIPFLIDKIDRNINRFGETLTSKYGLFTGGIMHSFRNSLSHIMVNETADGLSFYDADSTFPGAPKKFELAGTLDSFYRLKEDLMNPDLTNYVSSFNLTFLKEYFYLYQQYYMQIENKTEIEASMKALEQEKLIALLIDKLQKQAILLSDKAKDSSKKIIKRP